MKSNEAPHSPASRYVKGEQRGKSRLYPETKRTQVMPQKHAGARHQGSGPHPDAEAAYKLRLSKQHPPLTPESSVPGIDPQPTEGDCGAQ
jgi:hypothetical protein